MLSPARSLTDIVDSETAADPVDTAAQSAAEPRPRIAIMGEFSAGKSTLTNLLLGDSALPMQVTATQLPPVWLSHGAERAYGEAVDGTCFDVDLEALGALDLDTTRCLRVFCEARVLEHCDLIDLPGISDPNMDPDIWQRIVPQADAVLWCTHATQAWRQSEAAIWEEMPIKLHDTSLLLLTRIDRIEAPRDRQRVLARVTQETEGLFAGIYPISLTRALAAADDRAAWQASGAEDLFEAIFQLCNDLADAPRSAPISGAPTASDGARAPSGPGAEGTVVALKNGPAIVPRRVRPGLAKAARPDAESDRTAPLF